MKYLILGIALLLSSCGNPSSIDCAKIGMSTEEVLNSCGEPTSKKKSEGYGHRNETWFYQPFLNVKLYVSFSDDKVIYYSW